MLVEMAETDEPVGILLDLRRLPDGVVLRDIFGHLSGYRSRVPCIRHFLITGNQDHDQVFAAMSFDLPDEPASLAHLAGRYIWMPGGIFHFAEMPVIIECL